MRQMSTDDDLESLRRRALEMGYELRPQRPNYKVTGFAVEVELLARFRKCANGLGIKIQDAINQAITEWLQRHECVAPESKE